MTNSTPAAAVPQTPEEAYAYFRSRRHDMALLPQGSLALVNTQWFYGAPGETESVWGVNGLWSALPEGEKGVQLTAVASDNIVVDGVVVDGSVVVTGKDSEASSVIVFDETKSGTIIKGEDGKYALRVWDTNSDDLQNFGSIDAFDYNPDWVVTGTFTPIDGGRAVEVSHLKDQGASRDKVIPGDIRFTIEGVEYAPSAFKEGRALMIVFSDATSGPVSYSVGRFLMVAPNPDGTITLDFNRAYLPPCAFSYNFNCPMPPAE
ncbi:DUF1684 domain-containing protein, partial [uncultured Aurantimicrobium sp.]|uniref:DUF1684 domain-containing protein n=1 Tax=uncultured Aurantimicrobium sp. TaxID=1705357 RepID=UPI00262458EB